MRNFDPILQEGCSYIFTKFSLLPAVGMYRTTKHPYRINFLSRTRVLPSEQLPADLSRFQPVKFKEVLDGTLNPDSMEIFYSLVHQILWKKQQLNLFYADIIGHIVKICHIEHVNVNGKETEKLCLELRNSE